MGGPSGPGGGGGGGGGSGGGGGGSSGGGAARGGGGGEKKAAAPQWSMAKWRLRAVPFLARNMACVSVGMNGWIGFILLTSPQYREPCPAAIPFARRSLLSPPSPASLTRAPYSPLCSP